MRKISALVAVVVACGAMAAVASAGPASMDADGNALMLDASFNTPASSSNRFIQPGVLEIHSLYGNFRGNPGPDESSDINLTLPKGTRVNSRNFPACPVPAQQSDFGNQARCPSTSRIGSGKVSVDARRSNIQNQLSGTLTVYNGAVVDGVPTISLMAEINTGGPEPLRTELNFKIQKGPKIVQFDPLGRPRGAAAFTITTLDLKVGRTIKSGRDRFPFFETPTTCKKTWAFSLTLVRNSSTTSAKHTQPCIKLIG